MATTWPMWCHKIGVFHTSWSCRIVTLTIWKTYSSHATSWPSENIWQENTSARKLPNHAQPKTSVRWSEKGQATVWNKQPLDLLIHIHSQHSQQVSQHSQHVSSPKNAENRWWSTSWSLNCQVVFCGVEVAGARSSRGAIVAMDATCSKVPWACSPSKFKKQTATRSFATPRFRWRNLLKHNWVSVFFFHLFFPLNNGWRACWCGFAARGPAASPAT